MNQTVQPPGAQVRDFPPLHSLQAPEALRALHPETAAVHGGIVRSRFEETAEALYLTSGYVYGTAEEAAAAFANPDLRYVYSRYGNPTVQMFIDRLCAIEGAEAGAATASGMAAVFTALIGLLRQGDRLVASRALFGSCAYICTDILPRFGIVTELVDGTDLAAWERALATPAQAVFLETPTNPQLDIVDLAAVAGLAHAAGATVVVDNVFATPLLQRPLELGADVVVYSATKHIDGQGRCLGGAILGSKDYCDGALAPFIRHTGPSMSPFNAWVLLKGLETLALRVRRQCRTARRIARWLERRAGIRQVRYPFLASHPQADLARRQMAAGGTVVTFTVEGGTEDGSIGDGGRGAAFALLNALRLIPISNNLGDAKSLATHPASTTHRRIGPEGRAAVGIGDGMIRLSVGLEHADDLIGDLDRAIAAAVRRSAPPASGTAALATLVRDKPAIAVRAVDVHRAKRLIEAGEAELIDVREAVEYEDEHIPGAMLFPLSAFDRRRPQGDSGRIGIFHCRSGRRTAENFARFLAAGYREVVHMEGGIVAWACAGYPVRALEEAPEEPARRTGPGMAA